MKVFMKRGGIVLVGSLAIVSIVFAAVVQGTDAKLVKGSQVGVVEVGGLTPVEAQKKLRIWWEGAKLEKLTLTIKDKSLKKTFTPGELGVSLDDVASIAQVPLEVSRQVIGPKDQSGEEEEAAADHQQPSRMMAGSVVPFDEPPEKMAVS